MFRETSLAGTRLIDRLYRPVRPLLDRANQFDAQIQLCGGETACP